MTYEGELQHFLNVRVRRTSSFIQLLQAVYAQKVFHRFHHFIGFNQKTLRYPLPADAVSRIESETPILSEDQQERLYNFPYRSLMGALLYLAINTYAVEL